MEIRRDVDFWVSDQVTIASMGHVKGTVLAVAFADGENVQYKIRWTGGATWFSSFELAPPVPRPLPPKPRDQ